MDPESASIKAREIYDSMSSQPQDMMQEPRTMAAFGGIMGADGRRAYVGGSYGGNTGGSKGGGASDASDTSAGDAHGSGNSGTGNGTGNGPIPGANVGTGANGGTGTVANACSASGANVGTDDGGKTVDIPIKPLLLTSSTGPTG